MHAVISTVTCMRRSSIQSTFSINPGSADSEACWVCWGGDKGVGAGNVGESAVWKDSAGRARGLGEVETVWTIMAGGP